ncbi:DinB family protein [Ralstonia pickettii]|nr:DinB family protein [Ralstonia pickettii]
MYRKVDDFIKDWENARAGTIKALEAMTDEKLGQAIVEGHNTLGWLGWHITGAQQYFAGLLGLTITIPGDVRTVPRDASKITEAYKATSKELAEKVNEAFTDDSLSENVDQHGTPTPRGEILRTLIDHQTHHRGQITVLLRQAGLKVPGVMGPTREDKQ